MVYHVRLLYKFMITRQMYKEEFLFTPHLVPFRMPLILDFKGLLGLGWYNIISAHIILLKICERLIVNRVLFSFRLQSPVFDMISYSG